MRASILAVVFVLSGAAAARAGSLVDVAVDVGGRTTALYDAVDGSGRRYFEAREGCSYTLRLANRTGERLAAVVIVDGLNVISGQREEIGGSPGRMYVLGPWDGVDIRGWRTSLDAVRQFTFVDERASYASRVGKANRHMGWVEVAVYRERYPYAGWRREKPIAGAEDDARYGASGRTADEAESAPSAKARRDAPAATAERGAAGDVSGGVVGGYPGTGWGESAYDPATEVAFHAADRPAERITLRYEYARALRALGLLPPRPRYGRDRLGERDRGEGFAPPPRW